MTNHNDSIKKEIFNKEPDEPLTAEEHDILNEIIESERPQEVNIDLNDPTFYSAFELYLNLKEDNIAPSEKIKKRILGEAWVAPIEEPQPKSRRILLWSVTVAATIILIAGFLWWNSIG